MGSIRNEESQIKVTGTTFQRNLKIRSSNIESLNKYPNAWSEIMLNWVHAWYLGGILKAPSTLNIKPDILSTYDQNQYFHPWSFVGLHLEYLEKYFGKNYRVIPLLKNLSKLFSSLMPAR